MADCSKALELIPTYQKALSRRARVLSELGNFELALEDITAVVMLDEFKNQGDIVFADSVIKSLGKGGFFTYLYIYIYIELEMLLIYSSENKCRFLEYFKLYFYINVKFIFRKAEFGKIHKAQYL